MASYYTTNKKHYPATTRALLEAVAASKSKAPTSEQLAAALPQWTPDNTRNMLARLKNRLLMRSHGRPQRWVLTQAGHKKLAWLRTQDPALDTRSAPSTLPKQPAARPVKPPPRVSPGRLF